MQRIKGKSRKTSDEITGYLIEIAGDREDAEQAANECGVRIRIIGEEPRENAVFAVCRREDIWEILAWHDDCVLRLRVGEKPRAGDLMRISQPPEHVAATLDART